MENQRVKVTSEELEKLLKKFSTIPSYKSASCSICVDGHVEQRDNVESAGGSGDFVTTIYFCRRCNSYNIGETDWSSMDYTY